MSHVVSKLGAIAVEIFPAGFCSISHLLRGDCRRGRAFYAECTFVQISINVSAEIHASSYMRGSSEAECKVVKIHNHYLPPGRFSRNGSRKQSFLSAFFRAKEAPDRDSLSLNMQAPLIVKSSEWRSVERLWMRIKK
jgi:hypothetical protein